MSGFVGFGLDSVLFFVYAFFGACGLGWFLLVWVFGFLLESLILAQDERWRRA